MQIYEKFKESLNQQTCHTCIPRGIPSDFDDFGGHELLIKEGLPKTINEIFPKFNFEVNPTEIDQILLNKN